MALKPLTSKTVPFILALAILLMACAPAAVPTSAPAAAPAVTPTEAPLSGKITVWVLGNSYDGIAKALTGFNEKYPDIEVELLKFGWNDLRPKLQATLAAGTGAPDVVEIFTSQAPFYVRQPGTFVDLTDRFQPYMDDTLSFAFNELTTQDGKVLGAGWSFTPNLLYYREDILKDAGVDLATLKTWDDLIEAGKKVTQGEQYMFLTATQATYPQYWNYFTGMFSQIGGSPFDKDDNLTLDDDDKALKVLETLRKIRDAGISLDVDSWWTPAFSAALQTGQVATFMSGAFHISILKGTAPDAAGKWRVQLAPVIPGGYETGLFTSGGRALVIPQQSEKVDLGWAFIEYMLFNPQGIRDCWTGGAIVPVYLPAFSDPVFDEPDPYYGGQPVGRIVLDGLLKIHNKVEWHTGPVDSGQMSSEIMGPELRKLMTGEESPQEALDNALAKTQEQLGQ